MQKLTSICSNVIRTYDTVYFSVCSNSLHASIKFSIFANAACLFAVRKGERAASHVQETVFTSEIENSSFLQSKNCITSNASV